MKENVLIEKTIDFGARIVKLHRYLVKEKHEPVIAKQILRSGTQCRTHKKPAARSMNKACAFDAASHCLLLDTDYFLNPNRSFMSQPNRLHRASRQETVGF